MADQRSRTFRGAAVLLGGSMGAQGLSLLRNLLVARMIPAADFGIAAAFAVTMSLVEMLGDLSIDKLLVQARDGDDERVQEAAQRIEFLRGLASGALLFLVAAPVAALFGAHETVWAFRMLALVPVITGLRHLDVRRWQRELRFGPATAVDTLPQLASTLLAWPLAVWLGDYRVVLWCILLQVTATTVLSHVFAERRYAWRGDRAIARRILTFGWPLVVNALLMFAIFQGDRVVVGSSYGLAELGAYSLAFSITFVPTAILARVATPLFLPLLADAQDEPARFAARASKCAQAIALIVAVVTIPLVLAGGPLVVALFGTKYAAAADVLPWLAAMQGVRILRVAPVLAAVARADTVNSMVSNLWRSTALIGMAAAAALHADLVWIAAAGLAGELLAMSVSVRRLQARHGVPWSASARPAAVALAGTACALAAAVALPAAGGAATAALAAVALVAATTAALLVLFPSLAATLHETVRRAVGGRAVAVAATP